MRSSWALASMRPLALQKQVSGAKSPLAKSTWALVCPCNSLSAPGPATSSMPRWTSGVTRGCVSLFGQLSGSGLSKVTRSALICCPLKRVIQLRIQLAPRCSVKGWLSLKMGARRAIFKRCCASRGMLDCGFTGITVRAGMPQQSLSFTGVENADQVNRITTALMMVEGVESAEVGRHGADVEGRVRREALIRAIKDLKLPISVK